MGTLLQDLRYAIRSLRKSPSFSVAALLTLALAIGANAVVFSVLNAFILRPLNVPNPQSLFALFRAADADAHFSYPDYLDYRDHNRSFDRIVAFNMVEAGLDVGKEPRTVWVYEATGNYFDSLGIRPYLGRVFHAEDEHGPESAPYVVLSYEFWHTYFHDDRDVIGRVVQVNKHPFTIIGVAQAGFHGTLLFFHPDFYVPIVNQLGQNNLNSRSSRWLFMVMGHLKKGVSQPQAIADLNVTSSYLEKMYPKDDGKMAMTLAQPGLYGDYLGRPVRAFMTALMLLAGLILLAACANLGSLFAARAADRSREVALRLALGSSRRRVVRSLFTEALLLSLAGGALGLWCSVMLLHGLSVWQPMPQYPIYLPVNPDARVFAVALLLTVASGLLFGSVPVRQVLRTNPYEVVKQGSARRAGRRLSTRELLLLVQIALCGVLITSSIVAVRGLTRTLHDNLGFDIQNSFLVDADLGMAGYTGDRMQQMQKRMIAEVKALPGIQAVGLADGMPLVQGASDSNVFSDSTVDLRPANAVADANLYVVSPEYLHAAGTVLLLGRDLSWHDDKDSPRVAVINQTLGRRLFGSEANAVGHDFKLPDGRRVQVVGIVQDGKYSSLTEDPQPSMFMPMLQLPRSSSLLVVRSNRDLQHIGADIKSKLHEMDPGLPVAIQSRYEAMDLVMFGPRMATISLGILGLMGAMLSVTGVYGMAAYSVSKRLRELGIRVALGAQRKEVLEAALGRALKLLVFGSAAGLLLGILASRVLAYIVYQATPRDPFVLAGVVLAMAMLGLMATWIPAHRALKLNPMTLLREE